MWFLWHLDGPQVSDDGLVNGGRQVEAVFGLDTVPQLIEGGVEEGGDLPVCHQL